jgi:hypothetical protein
MKSYNYLEPRLSVAYQINDDQSIKASYNRMVQYLQLISNTSSPSLMSGRQVTVLLNHKLQIRWLWDISKTLKTICTNRNVLQRSPEPIGLYWWCKFNSQQSHWANHSKLRSYGLEYFSEKRRKTEWLDFYTLSKSEQQTPGRTAQELELTMVNGTILYMINCIILPLQVRII